MICNCIISTTQTDLSMRYRMLSPKINKSPTLFESVAVFKNPVLCVTGVELTS